MNQQTFGFVESVDDQIIALWRRGLNAEQIAEKLGMPETRLLHELNRVLREIENFRARARYERERAEENDAALSRNADNTGRRAV